MLPQPVAQLETTHSGEGDVQDDSSGTNARTFERPAAVRNMLDFVAFRDTDCLRDLGKRPVVLYNEDSLFHRAGLSDIVGQSRGGKDGRGGSRFSCLFGA